LKGMGDVAVSHAFVKIVYFSTTIVCLLAISFFTYRWAFAVRDAEAVGSEYLRPVPMPSEIDRGELKLASRVSNPSKDFFGQ